jgi:3-keto-L-gulonate-6-phosphate decarboxylase
LQIAIDTTDLQLALSWAGKAVLAGIDIVELGTPLLAMHGLSAVKAFAREIKSVPLYIDLKLMDFAEPQLEPLLAFGVSFVSVMLFSSNSTIVQALRMADKNNCTIAISSMGYPTDRLATRVVGVRNLGGSFFVAHGTGANLSQAFSSMTDQADILSTINQIRLAVAGGISVECIQRLLVYRPSVIIVGRGVTGEASIENTVTALRHGLSSWD